MSVHVRGLLDADLPEVAALQQACAGQAAQWNPLDYLDYSSLVAECDGMVRGFLVLRQIVPGEEAEILNLAVHPAFRRQGVAAMLLARARLQCPGQLWLEVRKSNAAALAFYTHHGFLATGLRRNYYTHPEEDAIVMRL
jgi:[ribosomal protein S18]-alanine N-acetyltransferase